jgi:hypothetical protein
MLLHLAPSPIAHLHRAIAATASHVAGAQAARPTWTPWRRTLTCITSIRATRAEFPPCARPPRRAGARMKRCFLRTPSNPSQQALLQQRIDWTPAAAAGSAGTAASLTIALQPGPKTRPQQVEATSFLIKNPAVEFGCRPASTPRGST